MTYKQKLGYTILGAAIMLVGLGLGAIVSPPLVAQRNGVFDTIQCKQIEVVDNEGNNVILMGTTGNGNGLVIHDDRGKPAISLISAKRQGNWVLVLDRQGNPATFMGGQRRRK